jgi:fermentation-respiration switch protein FrsA (DUF1100 family)
LSKSLAAFAAVAATAVVLLTGGHAMRDWLIGSVLYHPSPGVDITPRELGLDAEEVFLETEDGVRIHAFFLPAAGSRRGLIFLHGNAGNASHRLPNAMMFQQLGVNVLLLDYRGYGRSQGSPEESGLYLDARAGLAHMMNERGIAQEQIFVFGRSLGGAVAVDLAQQRRLAGVILESTFSSLSEAASRAMGPVGRWLARGRFDSLAKIRSQRSPLLFFHGDRDEIVAYELGRQLYEAAPNPKQFETIRDAHHNDTVEVGGRAYFERMRRFIDEGQ